MTHSVGLPGENAEELTARMAVIGAELLIETIRRLEKGDCPREKQNEAESSHVTLIDKSMGKIDFSKPAAVLDRLVRGMNPWPSAYTSYQGKQLKIWRAVPVLELSDEAGEFQPGSICNVTKDFVEIRCGEGALRIAELQLEGKKRMAADAFLRGFTVEEGTLLEA